MCFAEKEMTLIQFSSEDETMKGSCKDIWFTETPRGSM